MRCLRFLPYLFASVLLSSSAWMAHASGPAPRVVAPVDDSVLTKLSGNVPRLARAEYDRGEAAPATQLTHIRLVLSRSSEQEAAVQKYLAELQDKSSPNYHKWLTPELIGKLYGPADSDISAIVAWLESRGLKLESVANSRIDISFSGTVSQVEAAFHTQIHSFQANNEQFCSNIADPSIPSALAPVIRGVDHLNTIRPRAFHVAGPVGTIDSNTKRLAPMSMERSKGPKPDLTSGSGTSADPYFLYIVPGDAATIYDTPNSFNANFSSGTSYTGSGVTIGIGGDGGINASTVVNYRSVFLGDSTAPTISNPDNLGANDDTDEAYIDTELSGGLAPGATIHFYTSNDLISAITQAIDTDNTVDIFSLSFGLCELEMTTSGNQTIEALWQEAALDGVAVTVSTGDTGSASCDAIDPTSETAAQYGLSVSGYASTPYNIAVGGTDLYGLNSNFSTYAGTSEGSASTFYRTALKYIPESTWNDSSQTDTTISANVPFSGTDANFSAGSGGASSCSTNTNTNDGADAGTCTSGYAKPSWQHGSTVPADGVRDLPDVSLMAGNGYDPATWAICTDDTFTQSGTTYTENCTTGTGFALAGFGGTSTAAPAFAGILALVEQKTGGRLGQAAEELYNLYNGSNAAATFHDVTVGNNSVPCESSPTVSPDCVKDTAGSYFESSYNATTGYDLATGMGSVDATNLVNYWASATGAQTVTITATPSPASITTVQSLTVTIQVAAATSGAGTPSGTVTLSATGYSQSAQTLVNGSATFTVPGGTLAVGSDTFNVSYSGDVNFASSTTSFAVNVTAAPTVTLNPSSLTFASTTVGSSATAQTVTLTNTGSTSLVISAIAVAGTNATSFGETNTCGNLPATIAASSNCTISVTFTPTTSGSLSASVSITDNGVGTPQTISLTGTGASAVPSGYTLANSGAITVSPGATSSNTSTITVTPSSSGFTGAVALTCAVAPTAASDPATCSLSPASVSLSGTTAQTATLTIATTAATTAQNKPIKLFWPSAGGAALAMVVFFGIPARRRNWPTMLGLLVLFVSVAGLGCGGGGSNGGGGGTSNPGTTAGTYTVTVTGTSGSITETTTVTLTVN